jgi:hypothetical protein
VVPLSVIFNAGVAAAGITVSTIIFLSINLFYVVRVARKVSA